VECVDLDVFDWLQRPHPKRNDVTIANLFLHHFQEDDLRNLLRQSAHQTRLFVACEPRRANFALGATGLMALIGCSGLTIHDGRISVRAGFAENELSALWPADNGWRLMERQAGWFSHCFFAQRS
jgi:hypothetical protein